MTSNNALAYNAPFLRRKGRTVDPSQPFPMQVPYNHAHPSLTPCIRLLPFSTPSIVNAHSSIPADPQQLFP